MYWRDNEDDFKMIYTDDGNTCIRTDRSELCYFSIYFQDSRISNPKFPLNFFQSSFSG